MGSMIDLIPLKSSGGSAELAGSVAVVVAGRQAASVRSQPRMMVYV